MRNLAFGNQKVDWEHGADNSRPEENAGNRIMGKGCLCFHVKKSENRT